METIVDGIFSNSFWYIAPIIVTVTTTATGYINKWFHIEKKWIKQVASWLIASLLSFLVWKIRLISFGTVAWAGVIALAVVTGLSSNGFYDIGVIKSFINKITGKELTIS